MDDLEISVVMITCNRAASAAVAVRSLLQQQIDPRWPFELILVDDGSSDETPAMLAGLATASPVPLHVLQTNGIGVPAARNLGAAAARGRWIACFDDDQIAANDWLQQLRAAAESSGGRCFGGTLKLALPDNAPPLGPRARALLGEHLLDKQLTVYPANQWPASNNALIERELLQHVRGFDETFIHGGSDTDLFERIRAAGAQLWFAPLAVGHHIIPPHRLESSYFRWTGRKVGATRARILRKQRRPWATGRYVALRLGIALLRDLPALALAALTRNPTRKLNSLCSLWYTEGLVRSLIAYHKPDVLRGTGFLAMLDFRGHHGERPPAP